MVTVLLRNMAQFQSNGSSSSNSLSTDTDADTDTDTAAILAKFDLLSFVSSYLDQMIEYLVLFYSGFGELFTPMFYPLILQALGTTECSLLMSQTQKQSQPDDSKER